MGKGKHKRKNGKLYEPVQHERPHHEAAFEYWYNLTRSGALRSGSGFSPLAKKLQVSENAIKNWYCSFNWEERARERDKKALDKSKKKGEDQLEKINKGVSDILNISKQFIILGAETMLAHFDEVMLDEGKVVLKAGRKLSSKRALEMFDIGSKRILELKKMFDPQIAGGTADVTAVLIRQVAGVVDFEHLHKEQLVEVTRANFDRAKQMLLSCGIGAGGTATPEGPEEPCGDGEVCDQEQENGEEG